MVTRKINPESNQEQPGTDEGDHVESLDSIAALGSALDAGAPGAVAQVDDDKSAELEIAAALELLRAAAVPFAPEHVQNPLMALWSDKQLERIAGAIVDLCKFHGWTVGEFFTEYGPYLQLLAALGMPALATIKLLKMPAPQPVQAAPNGQQQPA